MTGPAIPLLRAEGAAVAVVAALVAWQLGPAWWLVALVLVAPDLSLAAYAMGPKVGAAVYNAAHLYVWPLAVGAVGYLAARPGLEQVASLWALHVGLDRALGFGLKLPTGFHDTHLGRIGKR
jgi:hypothetical protein